MKRPGPSCRSCDSELRRTFVDLGMSPLCESLLSASQLNDPERFYPLHVYVCGQCFLVQLEEYVSPREIFSEYAYFSSYSDSWLRHASEYVDMVVARFGLDATSQVVEIASNDGYLLQYFVKRGVPVLGIEPAVNVAESAKRKSIPTEVRFFNERLARQLIERGMHADLIVGNNVLAQVPALRDFVRGIKILLKPKGLVTLEFPHLLRLLRENQFDTIYHEHFSYFSLSTLIPFFASEGLAIFDLEELPTHGGSLRIFAGHASAVSGEVDDRVARLLATEQEEGLNQVETYGAFAERVKETKRSLLEFLIRIKREGKRVAGYGAPGKGNTLLNYCGIGTDFIDFTVDRNPYKHGKFTPGTHIPIFPTEKIREARPDYLLVLPWNLKDEIMAQEAYIQDWGGRFVVPIPKVVVYPEI